MAHGRMTLNGIAPPGPVPSTICDGRPQPRSIKSRIATSWKPGWLSSAAPNGCRNSKGDHYAKDARLVRLGPRFRWRPRSRGDHDDQRTIDRTLGRDQSFVFAFDGPMAGLGRL